MIFNEIRQVLKLTVVSKCAIYLLRRFYCKTQKSTKHQMFLEIGLGEWEAKHMA